MSASKRTAAAVNDNSTTQPSAQTFTIPATCAVGDIVIFGMGQNSGNNIFTAPAGWTPLFDQVVTGSNLITRVWAKKLVAGDIGDSVTFTSDGAARTVSGYIVIKDADLVSEIVVATPTTGPSTNPVTTPSVTTAEADNFIVEMVFVRSNLATQVTLSPGAGLTEDAECNTDFGAQTAANQAPNYAMGIYHPSNSGAIGSYGGHSVTANQAITHSQRYTFAVTSAAVAPTDPEVPPAPSAEDTGIRVRVIMQDGSLRRVTVYGVKPDGTLALLSNPPAGPIVVIPPPGTTPPPPPPPDTPQGDFVLGFTAAQVQALPRTGAAFNDVFTKAQTVTEVLYTDGAADHSGNAFCAALMYLATGETQYKTKVVNICNQIQAHGLAGWHHAAINRKFGGWALAAHLVGHNDASWKTFCMNLMVQSSGITGPSRAIPTATAAWNWDNNHGGAAMGTYIAVCAVNGVKTATHNGHPGGYENANKWLRGYLGDHGSTGFPHVRVQGSTTYTQGMGVSDLPFSDGWQENPNAPYGVVPVSASDIRKRGAVPADATRDGASFPTPGASAKHYVYGNVGRRMRGAIILAALGYRDIWQVGDQALKRWRQWCNDYGPGNPDGGVNQAYDTVINKVYGTSFSANPIGNSGEVMDGEAWLVGIPSWPAR